ncbi:MAG: DUF4159 domain-containing protein [Verrucomicrobiota bacterium]
MRAFHSSNLSRRWPLAVGLLLACLFAVPVARAAGPSPVDLTQLQCGNLIYAGNKSSVCFADKFLSDIARDTKLNVGRKFVPVKLDADRVFDFPFCVFSGEDSFALTEKERQNLRRFIQQGGFILASPGCSDANWDRAFRKELKLCFPDKDLAAIPMTHPMFSVVHPITKLTCKNGRTTTLEGMEINGRLAVIYSKEGLNDVANAKGCCCCGGNQINDSARVNVNIFTYALLY